MKIFISGPMRGVPYYGFPAFDEAKVAFEAAGFDVVTPADLDRAIGFDAMTLPETTDWNAEAGFDVRAAMRRNIDALLDCDALVSLFGNHWSMGCSIERDIAERCNIQTFYQSYNETPPELARVVQRLWTDRAGKGEV